MAGSNLKMGSNRGEFMRTFTLWIMGLALIGFYAMPISARSYGYGQPGTVATTYKGVVKSVREIYVQQGGGNNTLGIATGGIAGGVIGGALSGGKGVPIAAGAVLGAVTGSMVEKQSKQKTALEYIVALDNGELVTVIEGKGKIFGIGQRVYVTMDRSGYAYLSARGY